MKKKTESKIDNAELHDHLENMPSNQSNNRPFHEVLSAQLSRRNIIMGGLGLTIASFLAPKVFAGMNRETQDWRKNKVKLQLNSKLIAFQPVNIADIEDTTMPTIADEYEYQVLAPWGTPIEPDIINEYNGDPSTRPSSQEAALQIGLGHDGMRFFPIGEDKESSEGILCINHEFARNTHALGKPTPENREDVNVSQHIHGVSVVKIKNHQGQWKVVKSQYARRITANTPVRFSGPAAESVLLQNPNASIPLGTINNCGSGATPWGTYLTCEENFNGYFAASEKLVLTEEQERYGFSNEGFGFGWHKFDTRFDLSDHKYANEQHRYGWIVEIDPFLGTQTPVKRTALGRFKHEAIAIAQSRTGRIAAYMGDDQHFDYCYKYVSSQPWKTAIRKGQSPLDDGKLYVARFDDNGTGEWLELTIENPILAKRFSSQAEILIYVRIAADLLGATPMDRPEWTTIGQNGEVYWTLTSNSSRDKANAANPQAPNNDGHIIRTYDAGDHLGTTFKWEIFILASSTQGTEHAFSNPDSAFIDKHGRLFIGTDGGQTNGLPNQLVVFDTHQSPPKPKRLFVGVNGSEITGFTLTPDQRTAFVNIQHPGNGSPTSTNFPAPFDSETIPRDCTLAIRRKDGGIVGS